MLVVLVVVLVVVLDVVLCVDVVLCEAGVVPVVLLDEPEDPEVCRAALLENAKLELPPLGWTRSAGLDD